MANVESKFLNFRYLGTRIGLFKIPMRPKLCDLETPLLDEGFLAIAPIQTKLWLILCQNSQIFVTMATRVGLFTRKSRYR